MFTLAQSWLIVTLSVLFVIVCLFMMLVILIQKPKGGGLSGAFGGAGGGANDAFGAKTGDVLTWFTVTCFVAFLALAMGLTWTIRPDHEAAVRDLEQDIVDVETAALEDLTTTQEQPTPQPSPASVEVDLPQTLPDVPKTD